MLNNIKLANSSTVPERIIHLGPYLSNMGPIYKPRKNTTKV